MKYIFLHYCTLLWGLQHKKDMDLLDLIQRKAKKIIRRGWSTSAVMTDSGLGVVKPGGEKALGKP